MGHGSGIREVAWVDIAGGGQVVLDGDYAYVGHMQPPHGTSVIDVKDPAHPRVVASIDIPPGLHSHKVRVANDIMVVNRERTRGDKPADNDDNRDKLCRYNSPLELYFEDDVAHIRIVDGRDRRRLGADIAARPRGVVGHARACRF